MPALSKTDKTRPWSIKVAEVRARDPYRARREAYPWDRHVYGCAHSCWMCRGYLAYERRVERRAGKQATRDWQKEYE